MAQLRRDARALLKSRSFVTCLLYQIVARGATVVAFPQVLYIPDYVVGMTGLQTSFWMWCLGS